MVIECLEEVYVPKGETAEIEEDKEKKKPSKKKSKKKKDKGKLGCIFQILLYTCTHVMNKFPNYLVSVENVLKFINKKKMTHFHNRFT